MMKRLGAAIGILVGFLIETSLCYMPSGIAQTTSRHVQSVSTSPQISGCPATCAGNSRSLRRSRLSMISSPRNMDDQDYETSEIESAREKEVIAVKRQMVEFYNAFTSKNFEKMQKLWLQTPYIQCILPGLPFPVNGYESIMEMWETVFGTSDENFSNTVIKPSSMIVQVRGKMALVFCNEDVVNGPYSRQMHATNIYRKMGNKWMMVHHHVSPSADSMLRTFRQTRSEMEDPQREFIREEQSFAAHRAEEDDLYSAEDSGSHETSTMLQDLPSEQTHSPAEQVPTGFHCLHPSVTDGAILAVKELSYAGRLSSKDRTLLFQDIVSHHGKGMEASRTEIAYELLVARFLGSQMVVSTYMKELLDDFCDQCKVIAKELSESDCR